MHIAVIGATGLIGSHLLTSLIENPRVQKITTITRRPLEKAHDKVNQLVLSKMSPDHISSMSVKADVFVCALGTTIKTAGSKEAFRAVDYDLVVAFSSLAKKEQAKAIFVVSAMGSNKNSSLFYNKVKGEMEHAVLEHKIPSTYILKPSIIIGDRKEKRTGEAIGMGIYRALSPILPHGIKKYMGSEVNDIVNYIENRVFSIEPGEHQVSDFTALS